MEPKNAGKVEAGDGRPEQVVEELEHEKKRSEELLTRLKYMQADLENYRKRMDREMKEVGDSQVRSLIARLLVVQDELDLAVRHAEEDEGKEVREGIEMVRRNLWGALESAGVEKIESVGKPFDPAVHEAVEKVQGDSNQDMVVEEVRPGFAFRGQLLRPSMVKVELASTKAREESEK